jgi:transposase
VAKNVLQLYWVEDGTGEIKNVRVQRRKLLEHFANRPACLVGMEACGGSQHWARELRKLGHQARLLPAHKVKGFVTGNKSDAIDARAIWLALRQPDIKEVPVKSELQQAVLALHRMRSQLVKMRNMQVNELRGLLSEYGEVFALGRCALTRGIAQALQRLSERLPQIVVDTLAQLWQRVGQLDKDIALIEKRLHAALKSDTTAQRLSQIPGVGLLTATAMSAAMGDARSFASARQFAAWIGLVPGHSGTGGKTRLHGISKRGDTYLRTLLIHGARSVLTHQKQPSPWQQELAARRPTNVVVVAMANKTARTIWAMAVHGRNYDPAWSRTAAQQAH